MRKGFVLASLLAWLGWACSAGSEGNFRIMLQDAPGLPDSLLVTISEVSVHKTGGAWTVASSQSRTVDLIQLRNSQAELTEVTLEEGSYTEIRLVVASGQAVVGGQTYTLVIPSSEIKIPVRLDVLNGGATEVFLDFDAEKSLEVHSTGSGTEYILRPVITLVRVTF